MSEHEGLPVKQLRGSEAIGRALKERSDVGLLLVREDADDPAAAELAALARERGVPVRVASAAVLRRMTSTGPASQVLALVGRDPGADLDAVLACKGALWVLVGTAYPSNAGMVIRTAEGSGADGIAIEADWDHSQRRGALRTSMRADWYMPVLWKPAAQVLASAERAGHRVFAIENTGRVFPWQVDLTGACVFVVGGEADGIPPALLARADEVLRLPMQGFIPSYNLQAAVSAVAVERLRQLELGQYSKDAPR